jgi:hypothetical protein
VSELAVDGCALLGLSATADDIHDTILGIEVEVSIYTLIFCLMGIEECMRMWYYLNGGVVCKE